MKIEKGKKYLCIKDVAMLWSNDIAYIKDKTYESKYDGCLTDEKGDDYHQWPENECTPKSETVFEEVFIPEWGEEIEVSHNRTIWIKGIFVGIDPLNKEGYVYLLKNGSAVGYFGVAPYCRPQYRELTKQEIADKFEIPLNKLKIVD